MIKSAEKFSIICTRKNMISFTCKKHIVQKNVNAGGEQNGGG